MSCCGAKDLRGFVWEDLRGFGNLGGLIGNLGGLQVQISKEIERLDYDAARRTLAELARWMEAD